MNYKRGIPGKTTADVFFQNTSKPKRNCEAYIDAEGNLTHVILDSKCYKTAELAELGVSAVDFYRMVTLYL